MHNTITEEKDGYESDYNIMSYFTIILTAPW